MQKRIAITGGIGSGKSLVLQYLKEWGYPVYSCDEIYKEVIITSAYIEAIQEAFPSCIEAGQINRTLLAEIVFTDEEKRKKLNAIAHPLIMEALLAQMQKNENKLVFAEVPLLFEGGFEGLFDCIIVVKRNKEKRIEAIAKRDNISLENAVNRIHAQFDYNSQEGTSRLKKCKAYILENDDTIYRLKEKLLTLLQSLT